MPFAILGIFNAYTGGTSLHPNISTSVLCLTFSSIPFWRWQQFLHYKRINNLQKLICSVLHFTLYDYTLKDTQRVSIFLSNHTATSLRNW